MGIVRSSDGSGNRDTHGRVDHVGTIPGSHVYSISQHEDVDCSSHNGYVTRYAVTSSPHCPLDLSTTRCNISDLARRPHRWDYLSPQ
jgi:hypothetical protein